MPVGFHLVLGKYAPRSRLAGDEGKKEGVSRGVNEVVALRFFFANFPRLRAANAVVDEQGERLFQSCEFGAVDREIRGLSVGADGNAVHSCREGMTRAILTDAGAASLPFCELPDARCARRRPAFLILLLTGNHAFEEAGFAGEITGGELGTTDFAAALARQNMTGQR